MFEKLHSIRFFEEILLKLISPSLFEIVRFTDGSIISNLNLQKQKLVVTLPTAPLEPRVTLVLVCAD